MRTYEEIFGNSSSYDMELEKIKSKIMKLYSDLVSQAFKQSKPEASQDEISDFIDQNSLEFKGEGFEEEADGLDKLLELLMQDEDLDPVEDMDYEDHKVATGKEPKSRRHNPLWTPSTKPLESPKGGLFTPSDKRSMPKTKALKTPRGSIRSFEKVPVKVEHSSLKDIWDAEREKLLALVRRRNKESNVIL
jgi:hypothetical protein